MPAPPPAAPAAAVAAEANETADLAGSLTRYQRLLATVGLGSPSLDQFLAGLARDAIGAPAAPPPARAPAPAPAPAPPAAPVAPEEELVSITTLCYAGKSALDRALSLRERVTELVAAGAPAGDVQELLEEVFDLVRLGATDVA
jgi:hypothetical protein